MSLKTEQIEAFNREINRLKSINLKFKKRLPLIVLLGIAVSFIYPFVPRRFTEESRLIDRMDYESGVIFFALIFFIVLFLSYFIITERNKKKIDSYLKRKQRLEE